MISTSGYIFTISINKTMRLLHHYRVPKLRIINLATHTIQISSVAGTLAGDDVLRGFAKKKIPKIRVYYGSG